MVKMLIRLDVAPYFSWRGGGWNVEKPSATRDANWEQDPKKTLGYIPWTPDMAPSFGEFRGLMYVFGSLLPLMTTMADNHELLDR